MEVKVIIPPAIEAGKKTDIRDWCNRRVESGKSREEITAALVAMYDAATVVLPGEGDLGGSLARGDDRESECFSVPAELQDGQRSADFPLLAALGLEVIGEWENGAIEIYSEETKKFKPIRDINRFRYANLVQHATRKRVEKLIVREGLDPIAGHYKMQAVIDEIADAAAIARPIDEDTKRGVGCWDHDGDVVLVGDGEIAIWNCKGTLQRSVNPRIGKQLYNLSGNPHWFDFEKLSDAMTFTDPPSAVDAALGILRRWRWEFDHAPELVCSLVIATWIQKFWSWRPQVILTGEKDSGKSILVTAVSRFFSGLASIASQDTTPIGIGKKVRGLSMVAIIDELDQNSHCPEIYTQIIRPTGRGNNQRWTGIGKGVTEKPLSQIFWMAGIMSGIKTSTDADRVVKIELLPKAVDAKQIVQPSQAECEAVGQSLLAVAVRIARDAARLAVELGASAIEGVSNRTCETYSVPAACWSLATGLPGGEWLERFSANSVMMSREVHDDQGDLFAAIIGSHVDAGVQIGRKSVEQLLRISRESEGSRSLEAIDALEKVGIHYPGAGNLVRLSAQNISRHLLEKTNWGRKSIAEIFSRVKFADHVHTNRGNFWEIPLSQIISVEEKPETDDF